MKISSWNVNSVNARIDHLIKFTPQGEILTVTSTNSLENEGGMADLRSVSTVYS